MNSTPTIEDLRLALVALTPAQQVAAEALAQGATQQAAADAANVARETVTRWAGHIPAFQATLNLYRVTLATEQVDTARRIRGKALAKVEAGLDDGRIDPLAVLRVVGEVAPAAIGPTMPEAILDAEMNRTRAALPPAPPPRGVEAELEALNNPPPSDVGRAEVLTITRLATAAGLDAPQAGG
jgi:hypothetical protein